MGASSLPPTAYRAAYGKPGLPVGAANMAAMADPADDDVARLARELEQAEAFELRLRERIVAIRDTLAAGQTARALSLCNEALNEIDNAADVVAPTPPATDRPVY